MKMLGACVFTEQVMQIVFHCCMTLKLNTTWKQILVNQTGQMYCGQALLYPLID